MVDGALRSVTMELDGEQYDRMSNAHIERAVVFVEGALERNGQRRALRAPRDIETVRASVDEECGVGLQRK